jgi:hypothetical protein
MSQDPRTQLPDRKALPEADAEATPLEFEGKVQRVPFRLVGNWLIGSKIVRVSPATLLEGDPTVGSTVTVMAERSGEGAIRARRIRAFPVQAVAEPKLAFLTSPMGFLALVTLLLPILALIGFVPGYTPRGILITEIACVSILGAAYGARRWIWRLDLRRRVRGAGMLNIHLLAVGLLGISVVLFFFAVFGGLGHFLELLPSPLGWYVVAILQISLFAGVTFFFSVRAALNHTAYLETIGALRRPLYLREDIDLVQLGIGETLEQLGVPEDAEWRLTERKPLPDGGVWFVISWLETRTQRAPDGSEKKIERERSYEVSLGASGGIKSFAPRA